MGRSRLASTLAAVREEDGPLLLVFNAYLRGHMIKVLVDSGASDNFVSERCAKRCNLTIRTGAPMQVTLADGSVKTTGEVAHSKFKAHTTKGVDYCESDMMLRVLPLGIQVDVVLGGRWLRSLSPVTLDYAETRRQAGDVEAQPRWLIMAEAAKDGSQGVFAAVASDLPGEEKVAEEASVKPPDPDTRDAKISPTWRQRFQDFFVKYSETLRKALPEASKLRRTYHRGYDSQDHPQSRREKGVGGTVQKTLQDVGGRAATAPRARGAAYGERVHSTFLQPIRSPLLDGAKARGPQNASADGFWQVPMAEEDVEKTAFTTQMGAYEWLAMPQGLRNSPSQYQRRMQRAQGHLPFVRIFIDDVVVFTKGDAIEAHYNHMKQFLETYQEAGVYLKDSKAQMCRESLQFLGHTLSAKGCQPQHDKVAAIKDWPRLETVTQWAFEELKTALYSAPVLALPDINKDGSGWDCPLLGADGRQWCSTGRSSDAGH
ncbi:hypothetical protein CYMTET_53741 [Cymbomonas tetramitiformis]|uniref:Reverse transcriptase domain-containing protein n=1 Tax=Cymbomonas tetramitiformis TaxID=36881 RepID=A0AAE0BI56_9CHLO|nr:hypothetical protein CYMTET_53741 [Cymbomonas tetramitiformis]